MKIIFSTRTNRYYAEAEYDPETQKTIVLKGARVSPTIAAKEHFKGASAVQRKRTKYVNELILQENLAFRSTSTAACFIGGNSHNGLDDWKTEDGRTVREFLSNYHQAAE